MTDLNLRATRNEHRRTRIGNSLPPKKRKVKVSASLSQGEKYFVELAAFYAGNMHAERATLFGYVCLRSGGKVFAKLHGGNLAIKLPAKRIAALTDSGLLTLYADRGRPMKEWAVVSASNKDIISLAEEARAFAQKG